MNNKTIFPYRLFVEGVNDLHVVSSLCENHKLTENFNIEACGSDKNVIRQFKIAITNPAVYQRIELWWMRIMMLRDAGCNWLIF